MSKKKLVSIISIIFYGFTQYCTYSFGGVPVENQESLQTQKNALFEKKAAFALQCQGYCENVHVHTFENGCTFVYYQEKDLSPTMSLKLSYSVGSLDEQPHEAGYAHFIEHMLFKASSLYKEGEVGEIYRRCGVQQDAGTSRDCTYYSCNISNKDLTIFLDIYQDFMHNALLDEQSIISEGVVIFQEYKMVEESFGQSAAVIQLMNDYCMHHCGQKVMPIIGTKESIVRATHDSLKAFYQRHYQPCKATLFIKGSLPYQEVFEQVASRFSVLQNTVASDVCCRQKISFDGAKKNQNNMNKCSVKINPLLKRPYIMFGWVLQKASDEFYGIMKFALDYINRKIKQELVSIGLVHFVCDDKLCLDGFSDDNQFISIYQVANLRFYCITLGINKVDNKSDEETIQLIKDKLDQIIKSMRTYNFSEEEIVKFQLDQGKMWLGLYDFNKLLNRGIEHFVSYGEDIRENLKFSINNNFWTKVDLKKFLQGDVINNIPDLADMQQHIWRPCVDNEELMIWQKTIQEQDAYDEQLLLERQRLKKDKDYVLTVNSLASHNDNSDNNYAIQESLLSNGLLVRYKNVEDKNIFFCRFLLHQEILPLLSSREKCCIDLGALYIESLFKKDTKKDKVLSSVSIDISSLSFFMHFDQIDYVPTLFNLFFERISTFPQVYLDKILKEYFECIEEEKGLPKTLEFTAEDFNDMNSQVNQTVMLSFCSNLIRLKKNQHYKRDLIGFSYDDMHGITTEDVVRTWKKYINPANVNCFVMFNKDNLKGFDSIKSLESIACKGSALRQSSLTHQAAARNIKLEGLFHINLPYAIQTGILGHLALSTMTQYDVVCMYFLKYFINKRLWLIREYDGLGYYLSCNCEITDTVINGSFGSLIIETYTIKERSNALYDAIIAIIQDICKNGMSDEDIAWIKQEVLKQSNFSANNKTEWLSNPSLFDSVLIKNITKSDLQQFAQRYLNPERWLFMMLGRQ